MPPERNSVSSVARCIAFAALLALLHLPSLAAPPDLPAGTEISAIIQQLSSISSLRSRGSVRFEAISKPDLARYLEQRIEEETRPQDLADEELTLKLFGFVPADFRLKEAALSLLAEQAAAFYDFRSKRMYLSEWARDRLRDLSVIHELAHALADQNFNLQKFIRKAKGDSDETQAREAVIEGQAAYLSEAYSRGREGASATPLSLDPDSLDRALRSSGGNFPVFDRAPLYLRTSLVFPYTAGALFQAAAVERFGRQGYAEVFRHPPVSTAQVLHPEAWFEHRLPLRPRLPEKPHGSRVVLEGTLGELEHFVLLRQYVSLAASRSLAPKWRGGRYEIVRWKKYENPGLVYVSEWSDGDAARQFFAAYRACLRGKSKAFDIQSENETMDLGETDRGYFRLRLNGAILTAEENFPSPFVATPK